MTMMLTELTAWVVAVDFALAMASIMSMADWDQFGPDRLLIEQRFARGLRKLVHGALAAKPFVGIR